MWEGGTMGRLTQPGYRRFQKEACLSALDCIQDSEMDFEWFVRTFPEGTQTRVGEKISVGRFAAQCRHLINNGLEILEKGERF